MKKKLNSSLTASNDKESVTTELKGCRSKNIKTKKGVHAFDDYYAQIFQDRWQELRLALLKEKTLAAWKNPWEKNNYFLDQASIWAASALEVKPGERVLDLCAAPGGKSLILAQALFEFEFIPETTGRLLLNEHSRARRERLKKVLRECLPDEVRTKIGITGHDACSFCVQQKETYQKILLDVPCSSERHILKAPEILAQWSMGRSKRLAKQQLTMLLSAMRVLEPGGRLVYSTCAISPLENDEVINGLLSNKKINKEMKIKVLPLNLPAGSATKYGWMILPDDHYLVPRLPSSLGASNTTSCNDPQGMGPLYIAAVERSLEVSEDNENNDWSDWNDWNECNE